MASYDKTKDTEYTLAVQAALKTLGADLGSAGVDGKWGDYTERAYQANKAQVDAIVNGITTASPRLEATLIAEPETKSYDEWLSIGDALYAAQAEAQKAQAQRALEYSQEEIEDNRVQSAATLENAANARGFGRSSYVVDALNQNENNAMKANTKLLNNFSDALLTIEANKAVNAANYASLLYRNEQDNLASIRRFNAGQQQDVDIYNWKQDLADAENQAKAATYSASSGTSSKKSGSAASAKSSVKSLIGNKISGLQDKYAGTIKGITSKKTVKGLA